MSRRLGRDEEPQDSGTVVAVHYGDYRRQEIWVRSGANIGNWYPLGGEFGGPKVWDDPRSHTDKIFDRNPPRRPAGTVPLHPHWEDILARGPVTLLAGGDDEAYLRGWRAGRHDMQEKIASQMEWMAIEGPAEIEKS